MALHVEGQVVRPGEGPVAHLALERPVARVLPVVPRQLVGSGEFPSAILPGALVGLLARVRPEVGLEVRRFGVGLGASFVVARVSREPLASPGPPSAALARHSVGRLRMAQFQRIFYPQRWMLTPVRRNKLKSRPVGINLKDGLTYRAGQSRGTMAV